MKVNELEKVTSLESPRIERVSQSNSDYMPPFHIITGIGHHQTTYGRSFVTKCNRVVNHLEVRFDNSNFHETKYVRHCSRCGTLEEFDALATQRYEENQARAAQRKVEKAAEDHAFLISRGWSIVGLQIENFILEELESAKDSGEVLTIPVADLPIVQDLRQEGNVDFEIEQNNKEIKILRNW